MIDLLINGPIESSGISGKYAHIEKKNFPKNLIKKFNTIRNVIKIAKLYKRKFNRIIWNVTDEYQSHFDELYNKFYSNNIDIKLVCRANYKENFIYHPRWKNNLLAINNSIKYVKNLIFLLNISKAKNVMIIRSDQYINLDLIDLDFDTNFIYLPRIRKNFIEAGDTYILTDRKHLLNKLINAKKNNMGLDDNIHRIFWKSYAYVHRKKFKIPLIFFKLTYPYNVGEWSKKIAEYIQSDFLRPMSFNIYKSIKWRGTKYSLKHLKDMKNNYFFKENYPKQDFNSKKIPLFKFYLKDIYNFIRAILVNLLITKIKFYENRS